MIPHGNVPAFKLGPTLGTHWHPGFKSRARGWRHNWNCRPFRLNGEKRRAAFCLDFPPSLGSLTSIVTLLSKPKPYVCCPTEGNRRITFSVAKKRLFISFHLCLHFTQVSQIKALRSKLRFRVLKMLTSFELRASNRPSTHSHPAWYQAVV